MENLVKYPVRCCCTPDTVLGHLELVDDLRAEDRVPVMEKVKLGSHLDSVKLRYAEVRLRLYVDTTKGIREIAVYSDDHPIEFWRRLRGFTELKDGQ